MLYAMDDTLTTARTLIENASRIVVLTGAGISTESGIPDFRGPDGLWTKDPDAEMLSSYDAYVSSEEVRQRAWASRLNSPTWTAQPNEAHTALVELERMGKLSALITQNIDRLHHDAGHNPDLIIEIHGNAHESVCLSCGQHLAMLDVLERVRDGDNDPHCLHVREGTKCGGVLKSATISFGQALVAEDLHRAEEAARQCDLLFAIGSTLSVFPVAGVVPLAKNAGAQIIILNAEPTAMDELATVILQADITTTLTALLGRDAS